MPLLGVVTIGQSPRTDMMPEMRPHLAGVDVLEAGALDGLEQDDLDRLAATRSGELLTSKLADGSSMTFGRDDILHHVTRHVAALEDRGVDANLLVCTGTFPPITHRRPFVTAEPLVVSGTHALSAGTIGVICPLPQQIKGSIDKFARTDVRVVGTDVDPYHADSSAYGKAAADLRARGASVIVLDCMGYTNAHRQAARAGSDTPVLLARTITARLVGELVAA